jgi:choline dehydrogenase
MEGLARLAGAMSFSYDDIIVGAGSAGAVLAARLTEDPARRVLVLEAGPDYPTLAEIPAPLRDGLRLPTTHDWGYAAEMVAGRSMPYPRGKVIGGSSSTNATLAVRGAPEDYDDWAARGNDDWSWERVLPYFRRLEDDPERGGEFHGIGGPIPIRRGRDADLSPMQQAFRDACRALGFPETADHNAPDAIGVGLGPFNLRDGVRVSTAIGYLLPVRERPNLTIRGDCLVDRVLFNGRHAVGVASLSNGRIEQVFGRRITLAGGAIGSPAILLRSGIGPAADLVALGIEPVVDLPGVGANLIDHASLYLGLRTKDGAASAAATGGFVDVTMYAILHYTARGSAERRDMQSFVHQGTQLPLILNVKLLRPNARGVVRLVDRDPLVQPDIRLNLASDPEDVRRLGDGLGLLCALATSPPLATLHTGIATLGDGREIPLGSVETALSKPGAMDAHVHSTVFHHYHPVGTARMGPDDDVGAVVDQYCRVRGVEGLRVVDASVMPNIPRANTNLTCIMIGERVAVLMK